jgi:RimJ/RimL family protein N-acetyltransferase
MKDPNLLEATGSEPLSIEEEKSMQMSWYQDPKKCTFIVHAAETNQEETTKICEFSIRQNLNRMVGDVNLFLSHIEDESEAGLSSSEGLQGTQGEIDIMIAERDFQKKGLGRAATCAMLLFGMKRLGVQRFFCKINDDNHASLTLFKSLGFLQCNYAECFKQFELELKIPLSDSRLNLLESFGTYEEVVCPLDDE